MPENQMMMDQEDQMGSPGQGEPPESPQQERDEGETPSVFLPKAAFGDRPPKVGESLKDFKIVDIDPETGDVEAQCTYEGDEGKSDFDQRFPESEDEKGY